MFGRHQPLEVVDLLRPAVSSPEIRSSSKHIIADNLHKSQPKQTSGETEKVKMNRGQLAARRATHYPNWKEIEIVRNRGKKIQDGKHCILYAAITMTYI